MMGPILQISTMADENGVKLLVEELTEVKKDYEELKNHVVGLEKKYERMLSVKSGGGDGEISISARLQLLTADLFNNSMFSDIVVLLQGGTQIKAHKLILAASGNDWGVEQFDTIDMLDLTDMRYEVCYTMIKWVYTDEFDFHHKINDDFLIELMQAAKICKLESLFIRCQKALLAVVNSQNYDKILKSAEDLSAMILYEQCIKFTGVQHSKTDTELLIEKLKHHIGEQQIDLIISDDFIPASSLYQIQSAENEGLHNENSNSSKHDENLSTDDISETNSISTLEQTSDNRVKKSSSASQNVVNDVPCENEPLDKMLYSDSLTSISSCHGLETVDIAPNSEPVLTNSEHCIDIDGSQITETFEVNSIEITQRPMDTHLDKQYIELTKERVEDCSVVKSSPQTNSSERGLLMYGDSQDRYVNTVEDSNSNKDKDSVIITCNPNMEIVKIEEKSDNENEMIQNYDLNEAHQQIAAHEEIIATLKIRNPKKKSSEKMSELKDFTCNVCGKVMKKNHHLMAHLRIHTGHRPFKCDLCSRAFYGKNDLKRHMRIHTGEKPYKCDVCEKAFTSNCNLKTHHKTHEDHKPFICSLCDKTFRVKSNLTTHIRTHTGQKPFKCEVCTKAFNSGSDLVIHYRTHTGEKPFPCDVCSKCFRSKSNLKEHMRVHSEKHTTMLRGSAATPYKKIIKCDLCLKEFSSVAFKSLHLLTHPEYSIPTEYIVSHDRGEVIIKDAK